MAAGIDEKMYKKIFGRAPNTAASVPAPEVIPLGVAAFDGYLVPIGGVPRGMITEFRGLPSSWKSGAAYHLIAQCQKMDIGTPVLFDAENAFNTWATHAGVDPENLTYPEMGTDWSTAEECFKMIAFFISQKVPLIVVDSLGALTTRAVLENIDPSKESRMMSLPKVLKEWINRWIAGISFDKSFTPISLKDSGTAIVFINHVYTKIATSNVPVAEHNKYTSGGGFGAKFLAHLGIFFHSVKIEKDKETKRALFQHLKLTAVKTRFSEPERFIRFTVDFNNTTYDDIDLLIKVGVDVGIIEAAGAWYTVEGERMQGKEKVAIYLNERPELKKRIFSMETKVEEKDPNPFEEEKL